MLDSPEMIMKKIGVFLQWTTENALRSMLLSSLEALFKSNMVILHF